VSLTHLLDTKTCIYVINRRPPHVAEKFAQHAPDAVGLSSITLAELRYGVAKSGSAKNAAVLEAFIQPLEIVPFDAEATRHYGPLRHALQQQGRPIGAMDLLIAAHALALGVTLVTNNVKEFERVERLELENWF
jgi:tRNA(fMet)-specific endonuclease VapC